MQYVNNRRASTRNTRGVGSQEAKPVHRTAGPLAGVALNAALTGMPVIAPHVSRRAPDTTGFKSLTAAVEKFKGSLARRAHLMTYTEGEAFFTQLQNFRDAAERLPRRNTAAYKEKKSFDAAVTDCVAAFHQHVTEHGAEKRGNPQQLYVLARGVSLFRALPEGPLKSRGIAVLTSLSHLI